MKRFGIRNYGPTRQLPYKDQQIFIVHDGFINTDDEELAVALGKEKDIYVTDSGAAFVPTPLEAPEAETVVEAPDDISYADMIVPELKLLAKDRELDVKGLKRAEIIEALRAYDATPDKPDDSEKSETTEPEEPDVSEKPKEPESEDVVQPEKTEPEPEKEAPKKAKTARKSKKDKGK